VGWCRGLPGSLAECLLLNFLTNLWPERGQKFVNEGDRRVGVEGGAVAQGVFPAGLEGGFEILTHAAGGVSVQAAHAGDFVVQALLGKDLGDAIFSHPGLGCAAGRGA
jgi:hypothetical protein